MRPNHFTKGWQILIALLLVSPVAAQNGKGDVIKACLDKIKSLVIEATDLSNGGGFGLTRFQAHGVSCIHHQKEIFLLIEPTSEQFTHCTI